MLQGVSDIAQVDSERGGVRTFLRARRAKIASMKSIFF